MGTGQREEQKPACHNSEPADDLVLRLDFPQVHSLSPQKEEGKQWDEHAVRATLSSEDTSEEFKECGRIEGYPNQPEAK